MSRGKTLGRAFAPEFPGLIPVRADRPTARPMSWDGPFVHLRCYGSFQSTGSPPSSSSRAFTRLNGFEPKKPRSADIGDGCADST